MSFKSILIFVVSSMLSFFIYRQSNSGFLVKPYLQFSTKTGMYILWETHKNATTKVEYGEATKNASQPNLDQTANDKGQRTLHEVYLDKLKSETNYFYRVVSVTEDGKEWISKLYINDELLVDHDGDHSAMSKTGQTILAKGKHKIKIEYIESKGSQHLQAGYLDSNKNEIPFTPFELWR